MVDFVSFPGPLSLVISVTFLRVSPLPLSHPASPPQAQVSTFTGSWTVTFVFKALVAVCLSVFSRQTVKKISPAVKFTTNVINISHAWSTSSHNIYGMVEDFHILLKAKDQQRQDTGDRGHVEFTGSQSHVARGGGGRVWRQVRRQVIHGGSRGTLSALPGSVELSPSPSFHPHSLPLLF